MVRIAFIIWAEKMLSAAEKKMGLVRSDIRLRDGVSTCQSVRKLSRSVKPKNKLKAFVDPVFFRHYVECVDTTRELLLGEDDDGRRADRIMRKALRHVPLSTIYRLFRQGGIQVDYHPIRPEDRLRKGQIVQVFLPESLLASCDHKMPESLSAASSSSASRGGLTPPVVEEAPKVLWQNRHLLAFHKPRGMLVHDGEESLTAHALRLLRGGLSPSVSFSPGPLHRLDRNTSGIVVFSKTRTGAEKFTAAIRNRDIKKFYVAIVHGEISQAVFFRDTLSRDPRRRVSTVDKSGRTASLCAFPLERHDGLSLLLVELHTGITHQIRAQFAAHGMPLAGDTKYGGQRTPIISHYFLHSCCLYFKTPLFDDLPSTITDPLPADFSAAAMRLFGVGAEELERIMFQGIERLLTH
jgi:23S rRNA pseudouridine955/2504/2580 synthase